MQPEVWAEIKRLKQVEGLSVAEIARRVCMDRKTVRRAIQAERMLVSKRTRRSPSKLEPFRSYIQERLKEYPNLAGTVIFEEIKRQGYTGKIRILTKYIAGLRQKAREVFLKIETQPGEQAQVDWANCGSVVIGHTLRRLSCFIMVLSFSRMMYLEFTLSQCLEDFIACHINAFKYFQGITRKILYDNLKLVVLSRLGSQVKFNSKFMEFAGIFGFEPVLCNVARGNEKGKVESGIYYVRTNLLAGRKISWPQIQKDGRQWLDDVANLRLHRTTQERPLDRWEREKPYLLPLPQIEYDASIIRPVRSTHQALVHFDGNAYSVPHQWAHQTLILRASKDALRIFADAKDIAQHARCYDRGSVIENPKHFEGILALKRKAFASKIQQRFLELGEQARIYLDGLIANEVYPHRHITQIMELVVAYGKNNVLKAIAHAMEFKAFGAAYIKNIIQQEMTNKGLKEILPINIPQKPSWNEIVTEEPDLSVYDKLIDINDNKGDSTYAP
jgi:transposase